MFLFLCFRVFWLGGMWDLNSLTRDWTHTPCIGRWSLNHWRKLDGDVSCVTWLGYNTSYSIKHWFRCYCEGIWMWLISTMSWFSKQETVLITWVSLINQLKDLQIKTDEETLPLDGSIRFCLRVSSLLACSRNLKLASVYTVEANSLKLYILYMYTYIIYILYNIYMYISHALYFSGITLTNRNSRVYMQCQAYHQI